MTRLQKRLSVVVLVAALLGVSFFAIDASGNTQPAQQAQPATEVVELPWSKRCSKDAKGAETCEVFARLETGGKDNVRVAEFAITPVNDKGEAQGVVILPLGILLEQNVAMKMDEGKPAQFKPRFCTNAGCFSYLNLNKEILSSMRSGKSINFFFKTAEGQDVRLIMSLTGFGKAIKGLRG